MILGSESDACFQRTCRLNFFLLYGSMLTTNENEKKSQKSKNLTF